jgi:hypothetical protein
MALKNFFLNLRNRKYGAAHKIERHSTSADKTASFGILFTTEDEDKASSIRRFSDIISKDGKSVAILEFTPKVNPKKEVSGFPAFTGKDISLLGIIRNDHAEQFMKQKFDYLFLADRTVHPAILNILLNSHAKCRVGFKSTEGLPFLDLMISMPGSLDGLLDEMLNYTRKLS